MLRIHVELRHEATLIEPLAGGAAERRDAEPVLRPPQRLHAPPTSRSGLTELYRPNGCSSVLEGTPRVLVRCSKAKATVGAWDRVGGERTVSHSFCSTASFFRSPAGMPWTSLLPLESASQSAQNGTMFHSTTCVPNTAPTAVASRFHVLEMRIPPRVCDLRRAWGHVHERISIPERHTCSDGHTEPGQGILCANGVLLFHCRCGEGAVRTCAGSRRGSVLQFRSGPRPCRTVYLRLSSFTATHTDSHDGIAVPLTH